MSKLRQRIEQLRNVTIACNIEQAEKQSDQFIRKYVKKIEKGYRITVPDKERTEIRNYVYWLFIDNGLNWPFKKEPVKKLEAYLVKIMKELGVGILEQ